MQDGRIHDEVSGRPVMTGLGANLAVFVGAPVVLNGLIFGLGWSGRGGPQVGLPPGWVVGSIWVVLFVGLGAARWLLVRSGKVANEWVSLVGVLCLLYPLYTRGFSDLVAGLVGNVVTLGVAVPVAVYAWRRVRGAGFFLVPLCLWMAYAAVATARIVWR
jgi:tryptophan-rich sensory protein